MKKIYSLLSTCFCTGLLSFMLVSCGETYDEPSDNTFEGTWVAKKITDNTAPNSKDTMAKFITIRDQMIMFFTNASYDSSFYYKESSGNIEMTRINDTVVSRLSVIKRDDAGNIIYDANGYPVYESKLYVGPKKPEKFSINPNAPAVFATYTFSGNEMTFTKFKNKSNDTNFIAQKYIMTRASN